MYGGIPQPETFKKFKNRRGEDVNAHNKIDF
jgi:hypothetical protein